MEKIILAAVTTLCALVWVQVGAQAETFVAKAAAGAAHTPPQPPTLHGVPPGCHELGCHSGGEQKQPPTGRLDHGHLPVDGQSG